MATFDTPPPEAAGLLVIQELGGSAPIRVELRGGLLPEVGAVFPVAQRGSTYMPLGAREGFSTVTGVTYDKTEMSFAWDAAFFSPADLTLQNAEITLGPEGLFGVFEQLQLRARECLVQVGPFLRRGVLEKADPKPTRGYFVDPATGALGPAGVNLDVVLTWRWSGTGAPLAPPAAPPTGRYVAGQLTGADASFGAALAEADAALAPDALTALRGSIGRVRGSIDKLRRTVRGLGALAQAPANIANEAMAAARSLGNLVNDLDAQINGTRDAFLALGPAAESTVRGLGASAGSLARARRAKKALRDANAEAAAATLAVFDAIEKRRPKRARVRPGQLLSDVARTELGSADRWREIAAVNQLSGQQVPAGVYEVELPLRGGT